MFTITVEDMAECQGDNWQAGRVSPILLEGQIHKQMKKV